MSSDKKVAVLGGDEREHRVCALLVEQGYEVSSFGSGPSDQPPTYRLSRNLQSAVAGAAWIICPSPGLGQGDAVFAPAHHGIIRLSASVLAEAALSKGGLILGRTTPSLNAKALELGFSVFEMKEDLGLAVSNATAVGEAVLASLIENTKRLLREYEFLVIGFGATGFAITHALLAMHCPVTVAARSSQDRERARQIGAKVIDYAHRRDAFAKADIVINTVPNTKAVPTSIIEDLPGGRVIDIASPPGGMDHEFLLAQDYDVSWMRALAGMRAPISCANSQFEFISAAMNGHVKQALLA